MPGSLDKLRKQARAAAALRAGKPNPDHVVMIQREAERRAKRAQQVLKHRDNIDELIASIHEYNRDHGRELNQPASQPDAYGDSHRINPLDNEQMIRHIKLVHHQWTQLGQRVKRDRKQLLDERKARLQGLKARHERAQNELAIVIGKQLAKVIGDKKTSAGVRRRFKESAAKLKALHRQLQSAVKAEYVKLQPDRRDSVSPSLGKRRRSSNSNGQGDAPVPKWHQRYNNAVVERDVDIMH